MSKLDDDLEFQSKLRQQLSLRNHRHELRGIKSFKCEEGQDTKPVFTKKSIKGTAYLLLSYNASIYRHLVEDHMALVESRRLKKLS